MTAADDSVVAARLRARVEADAGTLGDALRRFYAAREFRPAWRDDSTAARLLRRVARAADEGLAPTRYPAAAVIEFAEGRRSLDPDVIARVDVTLTETWLGYAADLVRGLVVPERVDSLWTGSSPAPDLVPLLAEALAPGRVVDALDTLDPPYPGFVELRRALAQYRAIAARGGWPLVPGDAALGLGARGERVAALRAHLVATGDLASGEAGEAYDMAVETAVRGFQERHGLLPDGRVGRATLTTLNVSVEDRIRQIELNLERWRWLPRAPASRYVLVNSVAFELQLVEDEHAVMVARVIVGRPGWPTPIVSGALTHLVLNPVWNVPRSIALRELVPLIRSDAGYLRRMDIDVLLDAGGPARRVDPASVDWAAVTDSNFPYRLVQAPGPKNPLGRLKLVFPNPFNVALHDTPAGELFNAPSRTFSHGCIRVERVLDLAVRLLGNDPRWPPETVARALEELRERSIVLLEPVPVYVGYWTAWVGSDSMAEFRDDPYGWDEELAGALARVHPDFTRD